MTCGPLSFGQKVMLPALLGLLLGPLGCASLSKNQSDPQAEARQRLAEAPADTETHIALSEFFLQQRDYLRARQYLSLAERGIGGVAPAPLDAERVFRLAILIAVRSQQYSDAILRCKQRLEHVQDPHVRVLLARLLETTGDEAGAAQQLRLLTQLYPNEPERLLELARFYEHSTLLDRRRLSRELFRRYLEVAPQGAEATQVKAALILDQLEQKAARN